MTTFTWVSDQVKRVCRSPHRNKVNGVHFRTHCYLIFCDRLDVEIKLDQLNCKKPKNMRMLSAYLIRQNMERSSYVVLTTVVP